MKTKLTSRKFWISCAAFLGSIGVSIAGLQSGSDVVTAIGTICAVASAAIYAGCEAAVDKADKTTGTMVMTTNYYGADGLKVTEETEVEE
ncbi:MAG: hypothetical protein LIO75_07670 [Lachnospiraceae bacterium]|nr:hypothetical protein [Lachnospiraceae bacterium]